jgi:lipopolysaccharide transport system permease protein
MSVQAAAPGALAGALGRYRPLFLNLLRREVRQRYKGSVLGVLWTFIAPLTVLVAYSLVFHYLYRVVKVPDYALFALTGLVVWYFFAGAAVAASSSLIANANLVRKVAFPRALIPMSAVGGNAVTMLAMLAVLVPINLIVAPAARSPALVLLPVIVLLLIAMTYGFSLMIAGANVYFRDVEHILAALLLPWFFLTPIFYTPDSLPEGASSVQWLVNVLNWGNWVTPYVDVTRDVALNGVWPPANQMVFCVLVAAFFVVAGHLLFRRLEGEMAVEL